MALLDDAARPRPRAGCLLALGAACAALAYVGAGARDGGATLSLAVGAAAGAERFALPDPATVVVAPLDDRFALAGGEEYFSMTGRLLDRQVATETHAVFDEVLTEAEAWEALSVADFRAHCANVTFGYCGRSTCHIDGAKESSTCGCKKIVNGAGSIGFNSRNAYLIRSALVRRALYEITVLNESSYFVNTVCGAIKNKRFWHEAGFDSDFGSMSDADYGGYWAMVDLDCPTSNVEYNFAYCDGAPCDIAQAGGTAAFDANYDSMCICPYASANATSVLHEHITDATAANCSEIETGVGDCAIQRTVKVGTFGEDSSRKSVMEMYAAIKSASYLKGGKSCPTISFNNVSFPPSLFPTLSVEPTHVPTTHVPTMCPTPYPSPLPTTSGPSYAPTSCPSPAPTTSAPSYIPSPGPSPIPSTAGPTGLPSPVPSTAVPSTATPSYAPSAMPTTAAPSGAPSYGPSPQPTTPKPSTRPTSAMPSPRPTHHTDKPTSPPTSVPSPRPTHPTDAPSIAPSPRPTHPTSAPSTEVPSPRPTHRKDPTAAPSGLPSPRPTYHTVRPTSWSYSYYHDDDDD